MGPTNKTFEHVATEIGAEEAEEVAVGELPMNHEITYQLQDIFNLLPDVTNPSFVRSLQVNTNDQMLVMYIASVIRSVIALHNLINNKLANKEAEKKEGKKDDPVKDKKEEKSDSKKEEVKADSKK